MSLLSWVANKWPKFDIIKLVDGKPELYLRRFFIVRTKLFSIYLHYIPRPDEDRDPHDHPWTFRSLLLRGGYEEEVFVWDEVSKQRRFLKRNVRKAVALGMRPAETVHQIISVQPNTWTLMFTGPVQRQWGFLTETGWVDWRTYLNIWDKVDMD